MQYTEEWTGTFHNYRYFNEKIDCMSITDCFLPTGNKEYCLVGLLSPDIGGGVPEKNKGHNSAYVNLMKNKHCIYENLASGYDSSAVNFSSLKE